MTISATYYRNLAAASVRSAAQVVAVSGQIYIPAWLFDSVNIFNGSGLVQSPLFSGTAEFGFSGAGFNSGAFFASSYQPGFIEIEGSIPTTYPGVNGGYLWTGMAEAAGSPYAVDSSGSIFTISGGAVAKVGSFGQVAYGAVGVAGSSVFYSMLPISGYVGTFNSSTSTSGAIAVSGVGSMLCLAAASDGLLAVGGYNAATLGSGFGAIAVDPTDSQIFATATPSASALSTWISTASGQFTLQQTVSEVGEINSITWSALGNTIMGLDPTNGHVQIFSYDFSALALEQTLDLTAASYAALLSDSAHGLVAQTSANLTTPIYLSGTAWVASGAGLNIASPTAAVAVAANEIVVGCASGLAFCYLNDNVWEVASTSGIGFAPTYMTYNAGTYYAAGTSGSSGYVYAAGASGSFTGDVTAMAVQQGQLVVADGVNDLLRVFSSTGGVITQQNSYPASGVTALAMVGSYLLVTEGGQTNQYLFKAPYTLAPAPSGVVSMYNGSGWTVGQLGLNATPTAIAYDPSGNVSVVTQQNNFYTFATSGGLIASGAIPQFTGQPQITPWGASSLLWASGICFATSALNESFLAISGAS